MDKYLFDEFLASDNTLQVYQDNRLLFSSNKGGLRPLLEYIDWPDFHNQPVVIFDKIMGNAAALLSIKASGQEIYSPLGSQLAIQTLDKYGLKHHLASIIPYIQKPDSDEMCPMERLSINKEPEEFYEVIRQLSSRRKEQHGTD